MEIKDLKYFHFSYQEVKNLCIKLPVMKKSSLKAGPGYSSYLEVGYWR